MTQRPRAVWVAQQRDIELFLRSALDADTAASLMPSPQWQPRTRGAQPGNARFTHVVAALVSQLPLHLQLHGVTALRGLPCKEREAVALVCVAERPITAVARFLRCTPKTVAARVQRGLEHMAVALWDDVGHPRIPRGEQTDATR